MTSAELEQDWGGVGGLAKPASPQGTAQEVL